MEKEFTWKIERTEQQHRREVDRQKVEKERTNFEANILQIYILLII